MPRSYIIVNKVIISKGEIQMESGDFYSERELAELFGLSVQAIRNLRHKGTGPKYFKIANRFRYRKADILTYIDNHLVDASEPKFDDGQVQLNLEGV